MGGGCKVASGIFRPACLSLPWAVCGGRILEEAAALILRILRASPGSMNKVIMIRSLVCQALKRL